MCIKHVTWLMAHKKGFGTVRRRLPPAHPRGLFLEGTVVSCGPGTNQDPLWDYNS